MQKSGIVSTIILTLLLILSVLLMRSLIPASISQSIEDYTQAFEDAEIETENAGEMGMIFLLVAGTGLLAIVAITYLQAIIPAVISIFGLVLSLKNRKRDLRFIRFINKAYAFIFASFLLISIAKIIMFTMGY
jgi:flagellar biosynthesis protein FlhB